MPWETLKPMFRPEPGTVHMGVMKVDPKKCTKCGLCVINCPFRAYEIGKNQVPRQKKEYECFSCYNCMVVCPVNAISIVDPYHVDSGFYATNPNALPSRLPVEPLDANGKPDKWTAIEKLIMERRSVRNFKDKPVPETLIKRVLEAGRFAPSAGNGQPWKFIVITNKKVIDELNQNLFNVMANLYGAYKDDQLVQHLVPMYEQNPTPGHFDPRVILGGFGSVVRGDIKVFLDAPALILLCGDKRAVGTPQVQIGVCGENMNLAAVSLGLGACWVGFSVLINMIPPLAQKLGIAEPWEVINAMVLGYPKFKQSGIVPREFRPITWFREGSDTPQIET